MLKALNFELFYKLLYKPKENIQRRMKPTSTEETNLRHMPTLSQVYKNILGKQT